MEVERGTVATKVCLNIATDRKDKIEFKWKQ
jgi:hypothetical protein